MVIFETLLFLLLLVSIIYLPGRFILRSFGYTHPDFVIIFFNSFIIGISQYISATYILSWMGIDKFYYIFPCIVFFLEFSKSKKELIRPYRFSKYAYMTLGLLMLGTILMSYIMFRSGSYDIQGNLLFYGVNSVDAIWHIALIKNLAYHFPPTHPGLADTPLRGYNFFYDFLLANFHKIYPFSVLDLYFRYFSITLSLFFGIAAIALARFMKMTKLAALIFLFLSYFSQGIGSSLFSKFGILYNSPIVQSIANAVDPNVLLSIMLFYSLYMLLFYKKPSYLAVIVLAILPMIKIYTGLLAFSGLGVITLYALFFKRDVAYLKILILSILVAGIYYVPINLGAGNLIFAPLLLYKHYMESGSVLPEYQWILKYQVYELHNNYIRITQLYIIAIALFFIPSLSIRLVSIYSVKNLLKKKFYTEKNIFLSIAIITGFIIPSFFIQSVAVFVVVQFLWIIYFLLLIPTVFALQQIVKKVAMTVRVAIIIFVVVVCIPETLVLLSVYSNDPMKVNSGLIKVLTYVRSEIPQQETVLVLNEAYGNQHNSGINVVPIVSALSDHRVYYEPEVLDFLNLDKKIAKRRELVSSLSILLKECNDNKVADKELTSLPAKVNTTYVLAMNQYSCLINSPAVRRIHVSGIYSLYEVKE